MVKVAIAGGSGQVAKEVIDALTKTNSHDILCFTRKSSNENLGESSFWRVVDYEDVNNLVENLRGVHTILSFIQILSDIDQKSQKNLIDAAIIAGVKRFAPSEYGSAGTDNMAWWEGKQKVREYLKKINCNSKVLEYCLFQPGIFLDYLAFPHKTATYVDPLQTVFDFQNRRAIVVDGFENAMITMTAVRDLANIMARAVDYKGEWPEIGGIQGNKISVSQIIKIGERIRGREFAIDRTSIHDLEVGKLETTWHLGVRHKAVSEEQATDMLKQVTVGMLVSIAKGAWDGSDEWNQLFSEYEFIDLESFLGMIWHEKL
ncbi:hypothetical protein B0J11DRAFT_514529 [Dendryphion nanum]|uniref:NmrA-like domain-containing protein n=1 Tax=Dendryphion nanum TaxID=256645 RepID=A0A9P9EJ91_9PLEO|nr:hypothetical protein B0J11DRAFT_514529 [Dendryphion nanum]